VSTFKTAFFISQQQILINFADECFIYDLNEEKVTHQIAAQYFNVYNAILSPNKERLVVGRQGSNALLWELASGELLDLGGPTLSSYILGWLDNDHPIMTSSSGGVGIIDLPVFKAISPEDIKKMGGWNESFSGLKYYSENLEEDDLHETQVESYASDIWQSGTEQIVFEILDASSSLNLYKIGKPITHRTLPSQLTSLHYPQIMICNDKLLVKSENQLYVCNPETLDILATHKFANDEMELFTDLEKKNFYSYGNNDFEKWNLTSGSKTPIWSGARAKTFSITGDKVLICKEYNSIEIIDANTNEKLLSLESIVEDGKNSIVKVDSNRDNPLTEIKVLLESAEQEKVSKAFLLLKEIDKADYRQHATLIRQYPFHCLKNNIESTYFTGLNTLNLAKQNLGSIDPSIKNLGQLEKLNLTFNNLSTLPTEITALKNLKILDLGFNNLVSLPPEINKLTQLREIVLFCNKLKAIPDSIGELSQLEILMLNTNKIKKLPQSIGQLTKLRELDLKNNSLTELPAEISKLKILTRLLLEKNNLNELPLDIYQLSQLEELDLYDNNITSLSEEIKNLTSLKRLMLDFNQLSDLPKTIAELPALTNIYAKKNNFSSETKKKLRQMIPPNCRITF